MATKVKKELDGPSLEDVMAELGAIRTMIETQAQAFQDFTEQMEETIERLDGERRADYYASLGDQ